MDDAEWCIGRGHVSGDTDWNDTSPGRELMDRAHAVAVKGNSEFAGRVPRLSRRVWQDEGIVGKVEDAIAWGPAPTAGKFRR